MNICHHHSDMCDWPVDAAQQAGFHLKVELVVFSVAHHHKGLVVLWNGGICVGAGEKVFIQIHIIYMVEFGRSNDHET